jgi:hypothetical protein
MRERESLTLELDRIRREHGPEIEARASSVLAGVAEWVRTEGHGEVTVSAVSHMLASKFRVNTVKSVRGGAAKS